MFGIFNFKPFTRADESKKYYVPPRLVTEAEQGRQNMERLLALAGLSANHTLWKTVLSYADEHAANEQEAALRADLPDATRHYNAGRAASALDFAQALRELHAKAQAEAKKLEPKPK